MSEQKKTNKRKILTRTLILAACILVIAAVTVTTVFAVNDWGRNNITIDVNKPVEKDPDENKDNPPVKDPDEDKDKDKPTSAGDQFVSPVAVVDVANGYDFGKDATLGHWHFHTGLDLKGDAGTNVVACLDGTVESVTTGDKLDGTKVVISHSNGVKSYYYFIEAKNGLKQGDAIKRGDVIGTIAEPNGAEYLLGAHLHFEMTENGEFVDPTDYLEGVSK